MDLEHDFTVPVPVDQAWRVLLDVERIAPCMPGATLDSVDGDDFTGRLKVRLGAMTITYRGTARITSRDEEAHEIVIEASGKEARGPGTASATVRARLQPEGDQTRVSVHTTLNVTGRPAQFGRNILSEVGGKLIGRFAGNLAGELSREETPEPAPTAAATAPTTEPVEAAEAAPAAGAEAAPAATGPEGVPAAEPAPAEETAGAAETIKAAEAPEPADVVPAAETAKSAQAPEPTEAVPGTQETEAATTPAGAESAETATARAEDTASAQAVPATPAGPLERREAEPIDLLEIAGPSVAKRLVPLFAGLAALWFLRRLIRRRSRR